MKTLHRRVNIHPMLEGSSLEPLGEFSNEDRPKNPAIEIMRLHSAHSAIINVIISP